jgi:hypothetical protein
VKVALEGDLMAEVVRLPKGKVILFRFVGGARDGCVTRFIEGCIPFDPAKWQPYEIVDKTETETVVTVTWEQRTSEE